MAKVAAPLFERGYFEQLVIDRNRLYSQVLDNLNKAAVVGFSHTDISSRLKAAWIGKEEQKLHYDQAQECANLFRAYCLENNLLDYSLQIEMFTQHLWPSHLVRQYLASQYHHLIYDNIEEDVPVAHDMVRDWLPSFDSALLINDEGAGYRAFLGADPENAATLADSCEQNSHNGSILRNPVDNPGVQPGFFEYCAAERRKKGHTSSIDLPSRSRAVVFTRKWWTGRLQRLPGWCRRNRFHRRISPSFRHFCRILCGIR